MNDSGVNSNDSSSAESIASSVTTVNESSQVDTSNEVATYSEVTTIRQIEVQNYARLGNLQTLSISSMLLLGVVAGCVLAVVFAYFFKE